MNNRHLLSLLIATLLSLASSLWADTYDQETNYWLQQLDAELTKRDVYIGQKQEKIDLLNAQRKQLKQDEERFFQNRQVYDECMTFDSDLAMEIVNENIEIARRMHDREWETEWQIKRSFVLASTGLLMEALQALDGMNGQTLSHQQAVEYYNQMQYLYSHLWQYTWKGELKDEYQAYNKLYNDSLHQILREDDSDYLWHQAWYHLDTDNPRPSIELLQSHVEQMPNDSRPDAMLNYVLARLYETEGDENLCVRYLAKSSVADLRAANQDIASLEELAMKMYNASESARLERSTFALDDDALISRAYNYISVCLETTQKYNNRVRTVSISRVLDQILKAYLQRDAHQRDRLHKALWTGGLLLLMVIVATFFVWRQKVRLGRSRMELARINSELTQNQEALAEANSQLKEANRQLHEAMQHQTEANQRLREADLVKEEYISYLFSTCSNYISKLDDYRKTINRKAKVKQWDEVLQMTEKGNVVQDELKEFYHNFDAIFLNLYPDFIQQFNALLSPEEQIVPKKGELLNTDLRIYALVRLGINDSTKIAEFLHCSPQTVYNNRLKIRSRALVGKEDFVRTVQSLGRT